MNLSNQLAGAMLFLAAPLSSYKLRKDIENEAIESILEDAIRSSQTLEGVVLRSAQQVDGVVSEDGLVQVFITCKIRIFNIHDKLLPDPAEFFRTNSARETQKLVEIHPVITSKEKLSGVSPEAGDVVDIVFHDGKPRWSPTNRFKPEYNFGFTTDACGKTVGGPAQFALGTGDIKLVGDIKNIKWETKFSYMDKQLTPTHTKFLNKMVENLQALDVPPTGLVTVTSVKRTAKQQATTVYNNIKANNDWWEYGNKFQDVRRIALDGSLDEFTAIATMTLQIQAAANRGNYMSPHMKNGALDIRTNDIIGGNVAKRLADFKKAALDTRLIKGAKIELYEGTKEKDKQRKKRRDAGGKPPSREHLHVNLNISTSEAE